MVNSFFDKNNSGPRKDKTLATLDINKKSLVLYLGNMEKALETEEDLNMDFENIKMNLGKMRYYLDAKSFVKPDGSFNREMMDFVINNKLINHSFNTISKLYIILFDINQHLQWWYHYHQMKQ